MPDHAPDTPPSPFVSILNWSSEWPEWQRDALRRIVESGPLSDGDLAELSILCRARHGLLPESGTVPAAVPFEAAHIPGGADSTAAVSLSKLSGLENVGRLSTDQEIVFGNAPGLTLIYGENGAGKSGYARVIKTACRARGEAPDIKPDAFVAAANAAAKAKIDYRVDSVDTSIDWTNGSDRDFHLGSVFVFDSLSAQVHVGEDGPACFKPRGLDVLPELAKACDRIRAELKTDIDETRAENTRTAHGWEYKATTAAGRFVNSVSASTLPMGVDEAATFSEADEQRLADILAMLRTDATLKAAESTAAATRIRTFAETAMSRATSVDDTAMQHIGEAIGHAEATTKAAEAAAGPELDESDLPGSCNDAWRMLWEAAKAFSVSHAYPDKHFPVTDADAKCVLCQQTLQPDAIGRYRRFSAFVADETRKQAELAKTNVANLKKGVDPLRTIGTEAAGIKTDLDRESGGSFASVEAFANAVDARIAHAKKCLEDESWSDPPVLPASTSPDLLELADDLEERAREELAAADPRTARALAAERDELVDRKWLVGKKDEIRAQVARHAHIGKLRQCENDCTTNAITIRSGTLHELHVTEAFCAAFNDELAALGMTTLPVKLDTARGAKGERCFGIELQGTANTKASDIASEGEHRCIALAAFMAELSQASHKSALVFDDPVSSLDHKRRYAIANRLVKEAACRQVVVFTHDLAFVCDLERAAGDAKKDFTYRQVEWIGNKPGGILPHLAWQYKSDKQQIKEIKDLVAQAVKVEADQGETEYREKAQVIIARLRGACERLIEQTLLCGAVKRHDSQVIVSKTPGIAAVGKHHWDIVHEVWKACSNSTDSHAAPLGGPKPVPTTDDFTAWVTKIEQVIQEVKQKRAPPTSIATASKPK